MNFLIKFGADAFLKSKNKTKIIACIVCVAFFLLIMPVVPAMAAIAPFAAVVEGSADLANKAKGFFATVGDVAENVFEGRGFKVINQKKVEEQEELVYEKLREKYTEFSSYVQLDLPYIAATIYYPMNFVYDEGTIGSLNGMNGTSENQEELQQQLYDYYKKVRQDTVFQKSYITLLANNSISETITTYACDAKTMTDSSGKEITYYVQGAQIDVVGPQKFEGEFGERETCDKGVDSIKVYTYQNDEERYLAYLKEVHIFSNDAYAPLFEGLDDAAKASKLDTVISEIKSLKTLYADILGANQIVGRYSNICTAGVIVSGGDEGSAQGVYNLEDYVAGVITHENNYIDSSDPNNIESMKAQAIAARTYVLNRTNKCSSPIENSQGAQTFSQTPSEAAKRAANETAGMILTYNGDIFSSEYDAYYCTEVATCLAGGMCTCEYTYEPYVDASGNRVSADLALKHTVSMPTDSIRYGGGGHGRGMSQEAANYLQSHDRYTYDQILKFFYSPGVQIVQTGGAENGMDGMVTVENGVFTIPANTDSGLAGSKGSGPSGFNVFFWQRLSSFFDAAQAAGYTIGYTDAWRSYEAQVICKTEKPDLCATPGKSMHGWGIAADLDFGDNKAAQDWAHANAANYNLRFAVCADYFGGVCKEPWHIEPSEIIYK
jgi:uncharacterized protein (DUF697 family)